MPASNPFAPLVDVGGSATVGPASGEGNIGFGLGSTAVGDHHAVALYLLLGLGALVLLRKYRFRFSTQVG